MQFHLNDNRQEMETKLEVVVKSVIEDNERQKQIVLFGVSEETSGLGNNSPVNDILKCAFGPDKPRVDEFCRVG